MRKLRITLNLLSAETGLLLEKNFVLIILKFSGSFDQSSPLLLFVDRRTFLITVIINGNLFLTRTSGVFVGGVLILCLENSDW